MKGEVHYTWSYFFEDQNGNVLKEKHGVSHEEAEGLLCDHYLILDGHQVYGNWHPYSPE